MTQINITPFVDVMLVLLIVFMITAPLLTATIPVDLPSARASLTVPPAQEPLVVTIKAQGSVYLQDNKMTLESLVEYLKTTSGYRTDRRIFVRGDRRITYGRVLEVMDAISTAGFTRVALVARLPEDESP